MIALLMQHGAFVSAVSVPLAVIDTFQGTAPWSRINREETDMQDPTVFDIDDAEPLLLTDYDLSLIDESIDAWPESDERLIVPFADGLGFDVPDNSELPF